MEIPSIKKEKITPSKSSEDANLLKTILPKIRKLHDKRSLDKILTLIEKLLTEIPKMEEDTNQIDMFEE